MNKILLEIVEETNSILIKNESDSRLLKTNWFSLSSNSYTWKGDGPTTCREIRQSKYSNKKYPVKDYIVIYKRPNLKECIQIKRPHKDVVSDEYDEFVKIKFLASEKYNNNQNKKDLKAAEKKLSSAARIAENKTGKSYWRIKGEYERVTKSIASIENAINRVDLDYVKNKMEKDLNNYGSITDYEANRHLLSLSQNLISEDYGKYNINSKYQKSVKKAYENLMANVVKKSINNIVEIEEDGEFSELNGSFGLLVVLAKIEGSLSRGNQTKPMNLMYSELININNENHKLSKLSDLDLMIDLKKVKNTKKENVIKEQIPQYVARLIKGDRNIF